jgi:methionyl-tRNA synthetase
MLFPIIPDTSKKTLGIFNIVTKNISFASIENHETLKAGNKINKTQILFKKIENK